MLVFFLFILFVTSVAALVLYFNKGDTAKAIKIVLQKILENLKALFENIIELLNLIKKLLPIEEIEEEINPAKNSESQQSSQDDTVIETPPNPQDINSSEDRSTQDDTVIETPPNPQDINSSEDRSTQDDTVIETPPNPQDINSSEDRSTQESNDNNKES
ncbi:hypothetical protein EV06_0888 [Prochlorococcus sp. MIT 0602]|uniref:hypothetical protein n=1 Tax=Prochlorococcus sp. MIT 0602 TaxID=1499499 RepID=UPI0005339598|nr:hypothetical protein [Prochlorococcus sp. MIT 0602]KGG15026.1 hypothetical protein EV06_0888 [Prochlorococcus sp. MIT 0602]